MNECLLIKLTASAISLPYPLLENPNANLFEQYIKSSCGEVTKTHFNL